jgi:hypothetical protein
MTKNYEHIVFKVKLNDPMKHVVAERGGKWGSMMRSLSRCCGDRSERLATKFLVDRIRKTIDSSLKDICREYSIERFVKSAVRRENHDTIVCDLEVNDSKQVVRQLPKNNTLARLALKVVPHRIVVKKFINTAYDEIYSFLKHEEILCHITMWHYDKLSRTKTVKPRKII